MDFGGAAEIHSLGRKPTKSNFFTAISTVQLIFSPLQKIQSVPQRYVSKRLNSGLRIKFNIYVIDESCVIILHQKKTDGVNKDINNG